MYIFRIWRNKQLNKLILINTEVLPRRTLVLAGVPILKDLVIFLTQNYDIYGSIWLLIIWTNIFGECYMTSNQNTFHCHWTFFDIQFQASKIVNYCLCLKITFLSPRWKWSLIFGDHESMAWGFISLPGQSLLGTVKSVIWIPSDVQQWLWCLALIVLCGLWLFSVLSSFHTAPGSPWILFILPMTQNRCFLIVFNVENRAAELHKAV